MAGIESKREIREALVLVSQLASNLNGTFEVSICGIPKQIAQHQLLFNIIEKDVDKHHGDDYTLKDAYELQKALQEVYEVTIHVQAPSVTDLGRSLKEMASMLRVGIERKNIANAMINLMEVSKKIGIHERQKKHFKEHQLLDKDHLLECMKEDVVGLKQVFREKITEIKNLAPHISEHLNKAQQTYNDACERYDNFMHALEVPELSINFLRLLQAEIVREESKINPSNLHIEETSVLGQGLFGNVKAAKMFVEKKGEVEVEVQSIQIEKEIFKREYVTMMNELTYWANFPHDYKTILKFRGICFNKGVLHLVTEAYPVTLERILHEEKKISLTVEQAEHVASQIVLALMQLHDLNIMHRNLAPSNILFEGLKSLDKVKVSDFGLGFSKYFQHKEGASQYYAPEVLSNVPKWTFAVDIYAFGLIVWEMFQDDVKPFEDQKYYLYDHVVVGKSRPDPAQGKLRDCHYMQTICERCWTQDPVHRPLASIVAEAIKARSPIQRQVHAPRPPSSAPPGKGRGDSDSRMPKRGSFSRMNGQVTELSANSLELLDHNEAFSVEDALEIVSSNPEYAQHNDEKPNKRLMKLQVTDLYHDHLDLDTPIFYSFFGSKKLKDFDCAVVAELLKRNKTWIRLGLSYNRIGNLGLGYLANALTTTTKLLKLYLSENKISRIGPLADALEENDSLLYLDLDSNELGDIAATSIQRILLKNKTLLVLSVSFNVFTNDGAGDIAEGLKKNETMVEFRIEGCENTMTKKGRKLIKNAAKGKSLKVKTWAF